MKILITGGLGYVGSALIPRLITVFPKAQLIVLDNLSTGKRETLPTSFRGNFIPADIREFDFKTLGLSRKDFVVHLAALSNPGESFERPEEYEEINLQGTLRTAEACVKTGAAFFFPSTTSVYHQTGGKWIHGCDQFLKPQTPYAGYKLKAEKKIAAIKKLRYAIVRFATIYGNAPGITYQTAVNKFCWQASMGQPLSLYKTALNQYRPYLFVEDAAKLIARLIKTKRFFRETFHAASDQAAVKDVVEIIRPWAAGMKIIKINSPAMNALSYRVSSECLKPLGIQMEGSLREGIRQLLKRRGPVALPKKAGISCKV